MKKMTRREVKEAVIDNIITHQNFYNYHVSLFALTYKMDIENGLKMMKMEVDEYLECNQIINNLKDEHIKEIAESVYYQYSWNHNLDD